jgi:hypothetical protein
MIRDTLAMPAATLECLNPRQVGQWLYPRAHGAPIAMGYEK